AFENPYAGTPSGTSVVSSNMMASLRAVSSCSKRRASIACARRGDSSRRGSLERESEEAANGRRPVGTETEEEGEGTDADRRLPGGVSCRAQVDRAVEEDVGCDSLARS